MVVAQYFTRTMSVDAISTAVIVAFDAPGYARIISVDAIRTVVIVEVGSP